MSSASEDPKIKAEVARLREFAKATGMACYERAARCLERADSPRGRKAINDAANIQRMQELLLSGIAKSDWEAAQKVAELDPGHSLAATAKRLHRKYHRKLKSDPKTPEQIQLAAERERRLIQHFATFQRWLAQDRPPLGGLSGSALIGSELDRYLDGTLGMRGHLASIQALADQEHYLALRGKTALPSAYENYVMTRQPAGIGEWILEWFRSLEIILGKKAP